MLAELTLRAGLAYDHLTYKGRFFNFEDVPMRLRPLQQPTPPFWYMRNPETAAKNGMNCVVVGSIDSLEANVVRYNRIWRESNPGLLTAQGRPPLMGLVVHMLLHEDEQQAIVESSRCLFCFDTIDINDVAYAIMHHCHMPP